MTIDTTAPHTKPTVINFEISFLSTIKNTIITDIIKLIKKLNITAFKKIFISKVVVYYFNNNAIY